MAKGMRDNSWNILPETAPGKGRSVETSAGIRV